MLDIPVPVHTKIPGRIPGDGTGEVKPLFGEVKPLLGEVKRVFDRNVPAQPPYNR